MISRREHLELICGDPQEKPAAFSRFVFPFAYDPKPMKKDKRGEINSRLRYLACDTPEYLNDEDLGIEVRKTYFTRETAEVLFESAKWLEMEKCGWNAPPWKTIPLHCRGKIIHVGMLPPRLALFEWPSKFKCKSSSNQGISKILHTGFLMVDLYFPEPVLDMAKPEFDDLLLINDLFRYYQYDYEKHFEQYIEVLRDVPVEYDKPSAFRVEDYKANKASAYLLRWTNLLTFPVVIDDQAFELKAISRAPLVHADQRTYVWSAAILAGGAKALRKAFHSTERQAHQFGHWIKFLNVDPPDDSNCPSKTHRNVTQFERAWAERKTYHRWEEWGTWYGYNYHGGVLVGPPEPNAPPVWRHFRQMYFDMALLMFYVRVSLFRFSRCLTETAPRSGVYGKKNRIDFSQLRGLFSIFTIRYQFPLLSNHQQAIEMYNLAREQFDIEALYSEIKEEIDNTHNFLEAKDQGNLSEKATALTQFGIPIAVGALIASIFGMNANDYPLSHWFDLLEDNGIAGVKALTPLSTSVSLFWMVIIVAGATVLTALITWWYLRRKH